MLIFVLIFRLFKFVVLSMNTFQYLLLSTFFIFYVCNGSHLISNVKSAS